MIIIHEIDPKARSLDYLIQAMKMSHFPAGSFKENQGFLVDWPVRFCFVLFSLFVSCAI